MAKNANGLSKATLEISNIASEAGYLASLVHRVANEVNEMSYQMGYAKLLLAKASSERILKDINAVIFSLEEVVDVRPEDQS